MASPVSEGFHPVTAAPRTFSISPVRSEEDLKATIQLFYEYTTWLNIDLAFQGFAGEVAGMPGKYAPPDGELFLARNNQGDAIGCIALRPLHDTICEMKRLWVRDVAKGSGVGKALVSAVIDVAKRLGYTKMRLDTLPSMVTALKLYYSLGFVEIEPYYRSPIPNTHFLELDLK